MRSQRRKCKATLNDGQRALAEAEALVYEVENDFEPSAASAVKVFLRKTLNAKTVNTSVFSLVLSCAKCLLCFLCNIAVELVFTVTICTVCKRLCCAHAKAYVNVKRFCSRLIFGIIMTFILLEMSSITYSHCSAVKVIVLCIHIIMRR